MPGERQRVDPLHAEMRVDEGWAAPPEQAAERPRGAADDLPADNRQAQAQVLNGQRLSAFGRGAVAEPPHVERPVALELLRLLRDEGFRDPEQIVAEDDDLAHAQPYV